MARSCWLAWVLVMVATLPACGGGGGDSRDSSVSPSLAESSDPLLDDIPDLANSSESDEVRYTLVTHVPDGSRLDLKAQADDPVVARVRIDLTSNSLIIVPGVAGVTQVSVTASTGTVATTRTFQFSASPVSRTLTLDADTPDEMALVLSNGSDRMVDFSLVHNGFPAFVDRAQLVGYIRSLPESYAGEPFERKLWRFLVNNTFHWPPLSSQVWLGDPWALINSLGWGFCGEVAGAYSVLANEAGYSSRVWSLNGHVVPEISVEGRWVVYDPDLVAYYYDYDHALAGVEELAATPALITSPVDSLHPTWTNYGPYSQVVAGIYASTADNQVDDGLYAPGGTSPSGIVWLPAHAALTYPGIWTPAPVGYDGVTPYTVPFFKQAKLDLPAGFTGDVSLPFMPWDIQGTGHVNLDGSVYEVGSSALRIALQDSRTAVHQINVIDSTNISIVMMINPLRFGLDTQNSITVTGVRVGALKGAVTQLPDINQAMPSSVLLPGQLKGPIS